MAAATVVIHLDELEQRRPGFGSIRKVPVPGQLVLERAEEALDTRIVIAVPSATHARDHLVSLEQLLIGGAAVLGSLVGMMDQSG